jgi:hypothetical protein
VIDMAAVVRSNVDQAPPLTPEKTARLRLIIWGAATNEGEGVENAA